VPPQVVDRGMLTRYGRYRENKIPQGGPKLALLPCSFDTGILRARGRKP